MNKTYFLWIIFFCTLISFDLTFAEERRIEVTTTTAVRDSVWGPVLGMVKPGEVFTVISFSNQWYQVKWKGQVAWIYAKNAKMLPQEIKEEEIVSTTDPIAEGSESAAVDFEAFKQLAASPEEVAKGHLNFPNPTEHGIHSHSALIPIYFTPTTGGSYVFEENVYVEDGENFAIAFFSPERKSWDIEVEPTGKPAFNLANIDQIQNARMEESAFGFGEARFPGDVYVFEGAKSNEWNLKITSPTTLHTDGTPDGYIAYSARSSYKLYAHLNTYDLLKGKSIGLAAYLYDEKNGSTEKNGTPTPLSGAILSAEMRLIFPDGEIRTLPMLDNGQAGDGKPGDSIFGALADDLDAGIYTAQVTVRGITMEGKSILRTTQHLFPINNQDIKILRRASTTVLDDKRMRVDIGIDLKSEELKICKAFAEVWGTQFDGRKTMVAWIGGVTAPQESPAGYELPLTLDSRWIARAGVKGPFELRNVRVQNIENHFPFDRMANISLEVGSLPAAATKPIKEILPEMLMGVDPKSKTTLEDKKKKEIHEGRTTTTVGTSSSDDSPYLPSTSSTSGGKVMLVHGYCSGGVWPTSHFSSYTVFADFSKNRPHDTFAKLIRDFDPSLPAFGVVAHSQGGPATLHLYTYYWSGLDYVTTGSRLIQSVGSPYHGTPLAGNLAAIGDVFGAGCGKNTDLTYGGSEAWLSGIPSWARSAVYFWTTSEKDNPWVWDYCQFLTALLLGNPEDGVVEKGKGQLSGANSMGHKEGWCHTSSMGDPAQTSDYSRNSSMNSAAKR